MHRVVWCPPDALPMSVGAAPGPRRPPAGNIYRAFEHEVEAQAGKGIDPNAAAILIGDAEYLIAHCP